MRRALKVLPAVLVASAVLTAASPAVAATPAPTAGYDVSFPQAPDRPLPPAPAFAIVGVNAGVATSTNPSLLPQLAWAGTATGTGHPAVEVYVNTANPGPKKAAWWPSGDRTRAGAAVHGPYGHCSGGATRACAYVYGASLAADDLGRGVQAAARWWLDVEAVNTWSSSTARNRAVLEGMAARFVRSRAKVGLYALPGEFRDLIGTVPASSRLAALPSWIAGAADRSHAATLCSRAPLTRGRIQLVQWIGADAVGPIDQDLACAAFSKPPKAGIGGTAEVGRTLRAKAGTWPAGSHLGYRWTRDGKAIAKATHRTHTVTAKDAGHRLRVVVTAEKAGFSRSVRTSAGLRAHR